MPVWFRSIEYAGLCFAFCARPKGCQFPALCPLRVCRLKTVGVFAEMKSSYPHQRFGVRYCQSFKGRSSDQVAPHQIAPQKLQGLKLADRLYPFAQRRNARVVNHCDGVLHDFWRAASLSMSRISAISSLHSTQGFEKSRYSIKNRCRSSATIWM